MTFVEDDPTELVAVTKNSVEAKVTARVPLITHVKLSIESPAGSGMEVEQSVIAAPRLVKVVGVTDIAKPTAPFRPVAPT